MREVVINGYTILNMIGCGAIGVVMFSFSNWFSKIDKDSLTKNNSYIISKIGIMNLLVSVVLALCGIDIWIIGAIALLCRQCYEDFVSYEAYEIPLFVSTCICVIFTISTRNFCDLYWVLCALVIMLGFTKLFGRADTYGYIIALSLMSKNQVGMIFLILFSNVAAVVISIYKSKKNKEKLTKVKIALLPVIYLTAIIMYIAMYLYGFNTDMTVINI